MNNLLLGYHVRDSLMLFMPVRHGIKMVLRDYANDPMKNKINESDDHALGSDATLSDSTSVPVSNWKDKRS